MKNIKKLSFIVIVTLVLVGGFASLVPKVLATTGGGTATIAVDGGTQGSGVTVEQNTSHIFTTVLTIPTGGMTNGASSPTFTIPDGFIAPTTHAVATVDDVNADGKWSVVAGGCTVDSSSSSSTSVASGQVITVDITANCAVNDTITLTYKGTSATAMGATQLIVKTSDAGDTSEPTALTAGSPTITVTDVSATPTPTSALTPTPTPTTSPDSTPTPTPTSTPTSTSTSNSSSSSSSTSSEVCPLLNYVTPIIIKSKRVSPTSISITWGPYSGTDTFNVQYGLTNGNWLYNTDVTGFSTTINALPFNQSIWIQVAVRNNCSIGIYGESKLVGGPSLPNTGFAPHENNIPWSISTGILAGISILFVLIQRKHRCLFRN